VRIPVLKALKHRDFALLWVGQTISLLGDGIFTVALAWQALELDGGAGGLGLVLVVRAVARAATLLVGGALADRYPKRFLVLFGEAIQMVSVTWLTFLAAGGDLQLWQLALVSGTSGIGGGIFLSSSAAFVPELVPEDHYQSANSLRSTSMLLAHELVGPAVGGILVAAFGTTIAFGIDAATFLACIVALLLMRATRVERSTQRISIVKDVREGFSYVRRTPWLWITLVAIGTVGNFAAYSPLPVFVPLIVQDRLQAGADVLGLIWAGYGVGGLAGALLMGSRHMKMTSLTPAYLMWGFGTSALGVVAFAPEAWVAALGLAVMGFAGQAAEVMWVTIQQAFVPSRLLGRVVATDWLISLSLQPLGIALAAPLAARFGPGPALFGGVVICILALALGLTSKQVRHLEKPLPEPPSANPDRQ
jgi:MFS family permease